MRRFANVCMTLGAVVAVLGVLGALFGVRPSEMPAAMMDLAAFKLVFIAAGGLIAGGAILGRAARRADKADAEAARVEALPEGGHGVVRPSAPSSDNLRKRDE
jgi:hypothetical protein